MFPPDKYGGISSVSADTITGTEHSFGDTLLDDLRIAQLDPLHADAFFANALPALNEAANMAALVRAARNFVPSAAAIAVMSQVEAQAATRDLGMIAASMQRRQVAFCAVPCLEEALLRLSTLTNEVPADTVHSYGPRNPAGARCRKFTFQHGEKVFIDSFREGMANLPTALDIVAGVRCLSIFDRGYVHGLRTADDFIQQMVSAIIAVRRQITPEFFTGVLRPYFDPKVIGGKAYLAPGGAQMPLFVLDQIIWGIGCTEPAYISYFLENLDYQPSYVRELSVRLAAKASIVGLAANEVRNAAVLTPTAMSSLRSLERILTSLTKFRLPHLAVAKANFRLRPDDALGSGGYQPTILEFLADQTRVARNSVRALMPVEGHRKTSNMPRNHTL